MADSGRSGEPGRPLEVVRRPAAPARGRVRGGTLLGFMVGLVVGLGIAVVVAVFVTRAPVPFVNKANRPVERAIEPKSPADAPDPNKPLQSKAKVPPVSDAPPPPATPEERAGVLERLFGRGAAESAGLPAPADTPAAKGEARPADAGGSPAAKAGDARSPEAAKEAGTTYLLQAGAYRSQDDAENMKVKLALLGFEARVFAGEVNGQQVHRVRVGPYAQLDDMNKARARLAENGIEASVVRQR